MEPDITIEFDTWAKSKSLSVEDSNFYDRWAQFLDEEYNDQRKNPGDFPL